MSFLDMIGSLLIGPLKLLFEVIFAVAYEWIRNPGLSIIVLSLAMNLLVLPLYRRADAIQIEARDTENKLKDVVAHIKKTFSGDERMMILQTYYRQNNYSPLSVLSGSVSLLLEIPFFMAAYQFLSGVGAFSGASFGPISDLSVPDGLIVIGGFSVNLLPFVMTLVNVVSSSLYLKGFPLKTKIQLYGMAVFFLVFLYNSPAALVFYWTLNNLFSLIKTLCYRIKIPKQGIKNAFDAVTRLPLLKKLNREKTKPAEVQPNKTMFVCGGLFLTALVGLLIPSTYISASVQEYIYSRCFYEPVWYIVQTLCISTGLFLIWMGVFYWLANPRGKVFMERLTWVLSGIMLVNYMFFGTSLGILSPDLVYADGFAFSVWEHVINVVVVAALIVVLCLLVRKFPQKLTAVLLVGAIALAGMSAVNIVKTVNETAQTETQLEKAENSSISIPLSKNGENVVVIMLDRGIGPFIPYLMEENPTLRQQFDGFTYYENALSYGGYTNFATPALHGGYEYTPVKLNLRDAESLEDKHNEALKVVPSLFAEAGYDVAVIDPSYAGYKWIPDLSIYDDMSGVNAYRADGRLKTTPEQLENSIAARRRNFFLFSLMKTMPVSLQASMYDGGSYWAVSRIGEEGIDQVVSAYLNASNVLKNLSVLTNITDKDTGGYTYLRSNATHEATVLQEPTFEFSTEVDNSAYYPAEGKTITDGENTFLLDSEYTLSHYHVNMAAMIQLGNWFDHLRQNGVYDNTRIIVVSDHGRDLGLFDSDEERLHDIEFYQPIMLVKDFNAAGFTTVDTFVTNADVPALSVEGLIENPVNPFTGNPIIDSSQFDGKHYVIVSDEWDVGDNDGNQFIESQWATVSGNVRDKNNWVFYTNPSVLPPDLKN